MFYKMLLNLFAKNFEHHICFITNAFWYYLFMPYGFFLIQKQAFGHVDMATHKGKNFKRYFKEISTLVLNLYHRKMSSPPTLFSGYIFMILGCHVKLCHVKLNLCLHSLGLFWDILLNFHRVQNNIQLLLKSKTLFIIIPYLAIKGSNIFITSHLFLLCYTETNFSFASSSVALLSRQQNLLHSFHIVQLSLYMAQS